MRTIIVSTCILVIIFVISGTEGINYIETALFIKLTCHVLGDCPRQDCRVLQNIVIEYSQKIQCNCCRLVSLQFLLVVYEIISCMLVGCYSHCMIYHIMLCFKALCAQTKAPCVENRGVVGIQADVKKPVENALVHQVKRHLVYIQS